MTAPVALPTIDPTGRPPIELNSAGYGTGIGGSGSGKATSPCQLTFHAGDQPITLAGYTAGTLQEWRTWHRDKFDLTAFTECRIVVCITVAAPSSASLAIQYTINDAAQLPLLVPDEAKWTTIVSVPIDTVGTLVSDWAPLPAATAADVWLRWVTL
jgi:hypothetical protein